MATALLADKSEAEDVVHDVFVGFIGSAGRFRLTGRLKGYLATCVANRARNRNKMTWRFTYDEGNPLEAAAPEALRRGLDLGIRRHSGPQVQLNPHMRTWYDLGTQIISPR